MRFTLGRFRLGRFRLGRFRLGRFRLGRFTLPAAALSAFLLAGCAASGHAATSPTYQIRRPDFAAVRQLLAVRAKAVVDGDRRAFMATVDKGRPEFYRSQEVMYDNLQALPVASMRYDVSDSGLTNASGITGGPLLSPEVVEHVFFRGTDKRPVGSEVDETFVKRAGHWLLAADSTDTSQSHGDSARPWAGPRISVATRGPLIVVADASSATSASRLADTVTADLRFDARVLAVPVDDHLMVDATSGGSVEKFDNNEAAGAVTFAVTTIEDFRSARVAGYRVKVNPEYAQRLMRDPITLRHELTHYLMSRYSPVNPVWLSEGLAEYVAHRPTGLASEYMTQAQYDRLLRRPAQLLVGGLFGMDPATDYPMAMADVTYLVHNGGMSKLEELMRTFASYPPEPYEDSHTRQALEKVYGMTPDQVAEGAYALLIHRG